MESVVGKGVGARLLLPSSSGLLFSCIIAFLSMSPTHASSSHLDPRRCFRLGNQGRWETLLIGNYRDGVHGERKGLVVRSRKEETTFLE
jgi:hypothetical protein